MRFTWLLPSSLLLLGCEISPAADAAAEASVNQCESTADCLVGSCSDGICQSSSADIESILLEVTPPAGVDVIAGVRFTTPVAELPPASERLDLQLPHISRLRGAVTGADIPPEACVQVSATEGTDLSADGSLPVRVTLVPRERLLGLGNPSHTRRIEPGETSTYQLSMNVPPGGYDVYVEPLEAGGDCVRPPYLFVRQEVEPGDITFNVELPPPERLEVDVRFPGRIDELDGWILSIVDRDTGRLLSNQVELSDPQAIDEPMEGLEYHGQLAFSPVEGDSSAPATELVRLAPPQSVTAPTVYIERSVVELFQGGSGVIDQLQELAAPVAYTGRVYQRDTTTPAQAAVTLVATKLQLVSPGTIASFSRTVQTDEDGVFEVDLLPGTYLVRTEPLDTSLAQTESTLSVSGSGESQAGKVIEVDRRTDLIGRLISFDGSGVSGTSVQAVPRPAVESANVLALARGEVPLAPRSQSEQSDPSGQFTLATDPGAFRVLARPDAQSGFAWAVKLGVDVEGDETDLGAITLPLPRVVEGHLSSSDVGTVPSALVRAYAYLNGEELADDPEEATAVVGIGEARVDAEGNFRLLLPSRLR